MTVHAFNEKGKQKEKGSGWREKRTQEVVPQA